MTLPSSSSATPTAGLSCLEALGSAWRGNWSDFDGRTLRDQLDEVDTIIRKEVRGEDVKGLVASFYAMNDICPRCQHWTEYCDHA